MTATLITNDPIVAPLAQMELMPKGVHRMMEWVKEVRPECLPEGGATPEPSYNDLFPHKGYRDYAKLLRERQHESADLEFQRLARVWKEVALQHWPNLFPQPWMQA